MIYTFWDILQYAFCIPWNIMENYGRPIRQIQLWAIKYRKKHYYCWTIPKSNRKIIERDKIDTPSTIRYDFHIKTMFGLSLSPVVCVGLRIVVSNTYCAVYFVFPAFVRCTLCCLFLWIVYFLTCICPVSCVPYVASFSGLSIFAPSVFSNMYLSCVLCTLCCLFL